MRSSHQVEIARQGAQAWNEWRGQHPHDIVNLRGADLQKTDLRSANLRGADLRSALLQEAKLIGANLTVADLRSANLSKADISSANLTEADLSQANLTEARLGQTVLLGCKSLVKAIGLASVTHDAHSFVDLPTMRAWIVDLPDEFLLGVGFVPEEIRTLRSLYGKAVA